MSTPRPEEQTYREITKEDLVDTSELHSSPLPYSDIAQKYDSLSSLVSAIAHKLKGQLTGMEGGLYLLKSGYESGKHDRVEKGKGMIERNLRNIRSTVEHILYYARDREPLWEEVTIDEIVKEVKTSFDKLKAGHGLDITLTSGAGSSRLETDVRMLRAMLLNLVDFMLECVPTSDTEATCTLIRILALDHETYVMFQIEKEGGSLVLGQSANINATSKTPQGLEDSGPALVVAQKLAACLRGSIDLRPRPEPGAGIVCLVRLPKKH